VYNYRRPRGIRKSFVFPVGSAGVWHLLIRCAGDFSQASAHWLSVVARHANRWRANGRVFDGKESFVDAFCERMPNEDRAHPCSIAKEDAFKPMKFLRNGHAGPIARPADIDIAGACFSLK
jgi:hypothetical protein